MNLNNDTLIKTSLFKRGHDYVLFIFLLSITLTFSLLHSYENYLEFKSFSWRSVDATVIAETKVFRASKSFTRYKLKAEDYTFTTSTTDSFHPLQGRDVRLSIYTDEVSFMDFIKGFYTYSRFETLKHEQTLKSELLNEINRQHRDPMVDNLYGALYLAQSIKADLRDKLSNLGINHLAAISGFHLGFISLFVILLANLFYKPLHKRFIPYRNRTRDIMLLTIVLVFTYVAFLDFTPSLLRAFGMMLIGFILFDRGIKLISFSSLAVTVTLLLALFPDLLFALGFWLSVLGVFNLFLILKYFETVKKWQLFLLLHILVFILMLPWIVFIFGGFSLGQLLSPVLSMLFILFYPLSILAMSMGFADIFDLSLVQLFSLGFSGYTLNYSWWMFGIYVVLLIASMRSKRAFYMSLFWAFFSLLLLLLFY